VLFVTAYEAAVMKSSKTEVLFVFLLLKRFFYNFND